MLFPYAWLVVLAVVPVSLARAPMYNATIYAIVAAESDPDELGLNYEGSIRAKCWQGAFGPAGSFDIGLFLAPRRRPGGQEMRALQTIERLADSVGLAVDNTCAPEDYDCVHDVIYSYRGDGDILLCWDEDIMHELLDQIGVRWGPALWQEDDYAAVLEIPSPYEEIKNKFSVPCRELGE